MRTVMLALVLLAVSASSASACLFCGVPRAVSDSYVWITVWGNNMPEPGATVWPPDDNGDPPWYMPPADDFTDGGDYKGWRVHCDFTGCHWIWMGEEEVRDANPPQGNWWDGWDGDCNNPPIDPTGQEVWSWC